MFEDKHNFHPKRRKKSSSTMGLIVLQFRHLILRPYMVKFILQRTDEKLRWKEKQLKASRIADTYPYPGTLFAEKESDRLSLQASCFYFS